MTDDDRDLFERAEAAARHAYAPYSRLRVGAAARTADGRIVEGVNVENAAYPLGVCAERAALARAVTDGHRPGDVEAIAVTASPCGGCRQWLVEFRIPRVVYRDAAGQVVVRAAAELLPDTFRFET
jgi:cytidine deaminase